MSFDHKQKLEMEIFPAIGLGPFVLGLNFEFWKKCLHYPPPPA
jgi:hypothetical protein